MSDSLSVIIPVRNAETTLTDQIERLLEMLPDLTHRFDIVIVDDGSSDHTVELARQLACEYPQVRLIRHDSPCGREQAVHTGRTWAQGKIVLAPDDLAEFLSPAELRRQWRSQQAPKTASLLAPAKLASLNAKLSEKLTHWGRGRGRMPCCQPCWPKAQKIRPDEAHPRPPYLHHAAAFLEHLTKLALGE